MSIDIFGTEKCKVTFGLKCINYFRLFNPQNEYFLFIILTHRYILASGFVVKMSMTFEASMKPVYTCNFVWNYSRQIDT